MNKETNILRNDYVRNALHGYTHISIFSTPIIQDTFCTVIVNSICMSVGAFIKGISRAAHVSVNSDGRRHEVRYFILNGY